MLPAPCGWHTVPRGFTAGGGSSAVPLTPRRFGGAAPWAAFLAVAARSQRACQGDAAQRMLQDLAEPAKGDAVQEVLQDLAEVEWGGKARKDRGPTLSLTKPSSFSLAAAKQRHRLCPVCWFAGWTLAMTTLLPDAFFKSCSC
ncbi:unnamed protein product [Effrenium voratum]|uniref:Uncharacterized protein n=1 Tax=Effrenium voratum TaxID=2562239 RepID=A0AA36JQ62_9DINO|nr:unnamed protein product [Effrenium voratum]